jgi:enoyl-[acyl-carrier protein] reductase II
MLTLRKEALQEVRENRVCKLFGIKYPILQGGMAWVATGELASAVSNAGGLGIIGAGHMPPAALREEIDKTKRLTGNPFGVNIMLRSPFVKEVIRVVLEEKIKVVTTGAGNPTEYIPAFKEAGTKVVPVVASVALAGRLARHGVDAVIAEGNESGGHIGTVNTMCLVPQVADAVDIPVIAAGGVSDARGVAAAFCLGAEGVQIGTRFAASRECTAHENYKNAIIKARDRSAVVTGSSTGHPVRVLENMLTRKFAEMEKSGVSVEELDRFGAGKLKSAVRDGDVVFGSVMAGQSAGLIKDIKSVEEIIQNIVAELPEVFAGADRNLPML